MPDSVPIERLYDFDGHGCAVRSAVFIEQYRDLGSLDQERVYRAHSARLRELLMAGGAIHARERVRTLEEFNARLRRARKETP